MYQRGSCTARSWTARSYCNRNNHLCFISFLVTLYLINSFLFTVPIPTGNATKVYSKCHSRKFKGLLPTSSLTNFWEVTVFHLLIHIRKRIGSPSSAPCMVGVHCQKRLLARPGFEPVISRCPIKTLVLYQKSHHSITIFE